MAARYLAKFDDPTGERHGLPTYPWKTARQAWRRVVSCESPGLPPAGTTRSLRSCGAAGAVTGWRSSTTSPWPARSGRRRRPLWPPSTKRSQLAAPAQAVRCPSLLHPHQPGRVSALRYPRPVRDRRRHRMTNTTTTTTASPTSAPETTDTKRRGSGRTGRAR